VLEFSNGELARAANKKWDWVICTIKVVISRDLIRKFGAGRRFRRGAARGRSLIKDPNMWPLRQEEGKRKRQKATRNFISPSRGLQTKVYLNQTEPIRKLPQKRRHPIQLSVLNPHITLTKKDI